ncbi:IclR family acetate operon transcriptional repressor [Deinococcus metalli]|uniref:IclR family acetate operon transcriptional repressor n=1 Tax=Deinococcus metalli TaxID=1141878 RepID=A0A7W8NS84_9DEIO|nr:IclR family transcriptional regulator [Deinococcus metalli]MBB5376882.1 IclR family acetate operon transcriptional repressor [Deinococcus metalli]GHF46054.1 transcriptional regulator [Deinococcus metalli]
MGAQAAGGEGSGVRTLERGLAVLAALAGRRAATLTQLARDVNLSASTVSRLLDTLCRQGFAEDVDGTYRVGPRAAQVGQAYDAHDALLAAARPVMRAVVDDLNESVNLAALRGPEAAYVAQVEGRQLVRMFTQLGAAAPLHASGVGKVLMAWRDDADVAVLLGKGPYPAFTPHSLTTWPAYRDELARVRAQGHALDDQERELGVRCVAAPIRGADRSVVAALSVSAPTSRLTESEVPRFVARITAATGEISRALGWTP